MRSAPACLQGSAGGGHLRCERVLRDLPGFKQVYFLCSTPSGKLDPPVPAQLPCVLWPSAHVPAMTGGRLTWLAHACRLRVPRGRCQALHVHHEALQMLYLLLGPCRCELHLERGCCGQTV